MAQLVPLISYRCRDPRRACFTRRNARVCRSSVGRISGLQLAKLCLQACDLSLEAGDFGHDRRCLQAYELGLEAGDFGHDRRDGGCDGGVEVLGLLLGVELFLRL